MGKVWWVLGVVGLCLMMIGIVSLRSDSQAQEVPVPGLTQAEAVGRLQVWLSERLTGGVGSETCLHDLVRMAGGESQAAWTAVWKGNRWEIVLVVPSDEGLRPLRYDLWEKPVWGIVNWNGGSC